MRHELEEMGKIDNLVDDLMDDLKIPYVSREIIEYVEKAFNMDTLLTQKVRNNDEHLGFIRGVREVIGRLRYIYNSQNEREG